MAENKPKMSGGDPLDQMSDEEKAAMEKFIGGGASTSTTNTESSHVDKNTPKPVSKAKRATMKSHPLLLKEEHIKMINEISEKTMIAKQKIIRSILIPGLEKMHKEKVEK